MAYDGNLSRAEKASDRIADVAIPLHASLSHTFATGANDEFTLQLAADGRRYLRYDRASVAALQVQASYRRKLGVGLRVPWFRAEGCVAREESPEAVRDGRTAAVSLAFDMRLDEETEGSLGAQYERREQLRDLPVLPDVSGKPFSLQGRTLFARASHALGARIALLGNASWRVGDAVSSARRDPDIFDEASAIAPDHAFGPDFIAYRFSGAHTATLSAGLWREVSRGVAFEFRLLFSRTTDRGGSPYDDTQIGVFLLYDPRWIQP